jgi:hypothetical protein
LKSIHRVVVCGGLVLLGAVLTAPGAVATTADPNAPDRVGSLAVVCKKPDWGVECMIKCGQAGLACPAERRHPFKPDVGRGKLWKCDGSKHNELCKYIHENGDECTWNRKDDTDKCKYKGGGD